MLIGFSGASGSGKTTLVNALAQELRLRNIDVGVVTEVAREVFKKYQSLGFKNLTELRKSELITTFQLDVLNMQIEREEELRKKRQIVLTDRTIYDNLFFTIFYHSDDFEELEEHIQKIRQIERLSGYRRYDLIFLCEPIHENVDDGFRTPDLSYRTVQHEIISRLIHPAIPKRVLPELDLASRVDACLSVLLRKLKKI